MRHRWLRIAVPLVVLVAVAAASFSPGGDTSAQNGIAPALVLAVAQPPASPTAVATYAAARLAPGATAPQLPAALTDNGIRKPTGMTSDLDKLYRIGLLARASGGVINSQTAASLPPDLRTATENHTLALDDAGRVQVFVFTLTDPASVAQGLAALGMDVQRVSSEYKIVQGMIPIVALESATTLAGVGSIGPPERAHLNAGSVLTQGDSILHANLLRSTYGVDGTGVKVGILSDGAEGSSASQASGDLPAVVDTTTCDVIASAPAGQPANTTDTGAGAEGTAMGEIVHDLAPGAQIMIGYFGINVTTSTFLDFNAAVSCLDQHNDVVVDDIGWYNVGTYDGTSAVSANTSTQLNNAANPVRGYYTSVGNSATSHYQDAFHSSGVNIGNVNTDFWQMHQFQGNSTTTDGGAGLSCDGVIPNCGDKIQLNPGGSFFVNLQWNDPFNNSTNDYDLLVVDENSTPPFQTFIASATRQTGSGSQPVEGFGFANTHGVVANYDIVIGNYKNLAGPVTFDEFISCSGCRTFGGNEHNFNTRTSSVSNESDSSNGVLSLGAINQADPGNDTIESYSSLGPTNDGRTKPDATGIDGVAVTGNGGFFNPFFGTSAAAPHAAGIAALILSCKPSLKAGEPGDNPVTDRNALRNALLSTAVDLGPAGVDNTFGSGRLSAAAAAAAAGCVAGTPTPTSTPTITPTATNTPTRTSTSTPTFTRTPTNTPTITPTPTNTPTRTSTPTNTSTNTPTSTPTPTNTATNTPTQTPTATPDPNRVLFGASASGFGDSTATQCTFSMNAGTGPNRLLLVGVSLEDKTRSVTSVTYGTDILAFVASDVNVDNTSGNTARVEFWRKAAPINGPQTVTVTLNGASKMVCAGTVWTNVDQSTPLGAAAAAHGDTGSPSVTIGGISASDVVHDVVSVAAPLTASPSTAGQASRWNVQVNIATNNMTGMGSTKENVSGNVTMAWSVSSTTNAFAMLAVPIRKAPPATPTPTSTNTPVATSTNTPTNTATITPTPTPTNTLTATITPTITPTPTGTNTLTPTPTATDTPTATPTIDPALDSDGDGIPDVTDNCRFVFNPDQLNTDAANTAANRPGADGLGDVCDPDIAGDGYTNVQHTAIGKNPALYCPIMRADVDGDGAVSILDLTKVAHWFTQSVPPAPERYKQDADSQISILDLTRMAQVFIQSVSSCP